MIDRITTICPPISHRSPDDEQLYLSQGLNQETTELTPKVDMEF